MLQKVLTSELKYGLIDLVNRYSKSFKYFSCFRIEGARGGPSTSKRQPTKSDIAHLTEVSRIIVSFMLSNHASSASVSSETKEHILEGAKKRSYRPNLTVNLCRRFSICMIDYPSIERQPV